MHERFDFSPEVRDQGCSVAIVVGPNGAQSVFVILLGPPLVTYPMGIVETHQPGTVGSVQSQRIVEPMRLACRNRHLIDDETSPVPASSITRTCPWRSSSVSSDGSRRVMVVIVSY